MTKLEKWVLFTFIKLIINKFFFNEGRVSVDFQSSLDRCIDSNRI